MSERRVVITGLGVFTSLGRGIEPFWRNLLEGKSGIRHFQGFDVSAYDCRIAAEIADFDASEFIPAKDARRMDRFCCFGVIASDLAIRDAGLDLDSLDRARAGVIVGSGIGGLSTLEAQHEVLRTRGPSKASPFMIPMMIVDMASGLISIRHGLKGPNYCVTSACATSAHSIGDGFRLIRHGDADVMLTGGAEAALTGLGFAGFCAMKAMSTRNDEPERASRPFDRERDGFVMGEGAAVLVVEELEHARRRGARIYCEIVGFGMTGDGYHITQPAPGGEGAVRCMRAALEEAGIAPDQVDYINAHGTSTPLNDKFETEAIKTVFGDHAYRLAVSSTKSMTGHLLGAAGAVELAACAMALTEDRIPPTTNYEVPDPDCDLDYVPNVARERRVEVALSNSLGFGGHNATLAVRKFR